MMASRSAGIFLNLPLEYSRMMLKASGKIQQSLSVMLEFQPCIADNKGWHVYYQYTLLDMTIPLSSQSSAIFFQMQRSNTGLGQRRGDKAILQIHPRYPDEPNYPSLALLHVIPHSSHTFSTMGTCHCLLWQEEEMPNENQVYRPMSLIVAR